MQAASPPGRFCGEAVNTFGSVLGEKGKHRSRPARPVLGGTPTKCHLGRLCAEARVGCIDFDYTVVLSTIYFFATASCGIKFTDVGQIHSKKRRHQASHSQELPLGMIRFQRQDPADAAGVPLGD